jgi:hypothetical protein
LKNLFSLFFFITQISLSQVVLSSDGPGNTYELINSVFANAGRNVVEVPDCNHESFGRHIDEIFDNELNKNVFRFFIHTEPDNDRCQKDDRQRNEIKSFDDSPENVKANIGEIIEYKWKFRLSEDFKVSPNFTHIHQIKSVGGSYASIPMITLTLRKSSPDRLELRYTPIDDQNTLKTANLDLFRGKWVEVRELIKFGDSGFYSIEIKEVSSNQLIFDYENTNIDMWQDGAAFARPKWGIYRSLINQQDLKDEIVKFADFSVEENPSSLSLLDNTKKINDIVLFPNPTSNKIYLKNVKLDDYDTIEVYDRLGKINIINQKVEDNSLDVSSLSKGLYFVILKKDSLITKVLKCYIQ